jgi:hypothetical protein
MTLKPIYCGAGENVQKKFSGPNRAEFAARGDFTRTDLPAGVVSTAPNRATIVAGGFRCVDPVLL